MNQSCDKNLPVGWLNIEFEEIIDLISGQHILSKDYSDQPIGIPYLTGPADFEEVYPAVSKWTKNPKVIAQEKDILITVKGAGVGKTNILGIEKAAISRQLMAIRSKAIEPYYMFFFLKANFDNLQKLGAGSTVPGIDRKTLLSIPISLPPLNEQHRIVAKIEALTTRSRKARAALDAIPALLDQFRQSVLAAAFRGDLTADWRAQNPDVESAEVSISRDFLQSYNNLDDLPLQWRWTQIDNLGDVKGGKRLPKGQKLINRDTGFPYIKAGDLKNGTVILTGIQYVTEDIHKVISRYIVMAGDVYITIVGACIGDAGVIPQELDGANLTENAAKICNLTQVNNEYLALWLRSPLCQRAIKTKVLSAAQGKLALSRIKTLPVPIAPKNEQIEIVKKVKYLLQWIDQLDGIYSDSTDNIDQLDQSILTKAFRGQLVPQDPNDEPASVLLERIQTERAKTEKKRKGGREKGKKVKTQKTAKTT